MGRKRKELKLHQVKGYYTTYVSNGKTHYKYFGTRDLEEGYQAYQKWAARKRRAEMAGKTLEELGAETDRRRMKGRKLWAQFILSLPDDFSGSRERMEKLFRPWVRVKRKNGS